MIEHSFSVGDVVHGDQFGLHYGIEDCHSRGLSRGVVSQLVGTYQIRVKWASGRGEGLWHHMWITHISPLKLLAEAAE